MNVVDSSGWLEYFADAENVEAKKPTEDRLDRVENSEITSANTRGKWTNR